MAPPGVLFTLLGSGKFPTRSNMGLEVLKVKSKNIQHRASCNILAPSVKSIAVSRHHSYQRALPTYQSVTHSTEGGTSRSSLHSKGRVGAGTTAQSQALQPLPGVPFSCPTGKEHLAHRCFRPLPGVAHIYFQ